MVYDLTTVWTRFSGFLSVCFGVCLVLGLGETDGFIDIGELLGPEGMAAVGIALIVGGVFAYVVRKWVFIDTENDLVLVRWGCVSFVLRSKDYAMGSFKTVTICQGARTSR